MSCFFKKWQGTRTARFRSCSFLTSHRLYFFSSFFLFGVVCVAVTAGGRREGFHGTRGPQHVHPAAAFGREAHQGPELQLEGTVVKPSRRVNKTAAIRAWLGCLAVMIHEPVWYCYTSSTSHQPPPPSPLLPFLCAALHVFAWCCLAWLGVALLGLAFFARRGLAWPVRYAWLGFPSWRGRASRRSSGWRTRPWSRTTLTRSFSLTVGTT